MTIVLVADMVLEASEFGGLGSMAVGGAVGLEPVE
jgi:hypothetical protein